MAKRLSKNLAIMIMECNLDCPLCHKGKIRVVTRKIFSVKYGLEMFNEICCNTCDKPVVVTFDTTTGDVVSITETTRALIGR